MFTMFRLAARTLRFRTTAFIATFVAMFLGAAIVMACGGLMETGIRMAAPPQLFAGAPIVVTAPQTYHSAALTEQSHLDPALVDTVRSVPGVADAVGVLTFPATVVVNGHPLPGAETPPGAETCYGHNWTAAELTPYTLVRGVAPAGADQVVLDSALAAASGASVGSAITVTADGDTRTFTVVGIARDSTATDRAGQPSRSAMFFSSAEAQLLAGTGGRVDAIGVLPAPGASVPALGSAVSAAVNGRAVVLTGDQRGLAELPGTLASQKTITILAAIFGGFIVLIVAFGVASTLGLALRQRQREMALLRAIGTTSAQLRGMILGDTMVLSVLATGLATIPGLLLGKVLFGQLTAHGVVSGSIVFHEGWIPTTVGAVVAIVAALGATLFAGRRAARTKPVAALAESVVQGSWFSVGRLLLALFFLVNGVGLAMITATVMTDGPTLASTAGPASVLFAIGLALLAPGLTKAMVLALGWPLRWVSGLSGYLAVRNATTNTVRMAGAVTPIVLLIGIATGTLYMQSTEDAVSARGYANSMRADYLLGSTTGGFAPGVLGAVRALPGVAGASELVTSTGFVDSDGGSTITMRGVSANGVERTLSVDPVAGSLTGLTGDTIALSDRQASTYGVKVGDTLPIHFGDGVAAHPRVVALYADDPNQEFLLLPAETLAPHTTAGLPTRIMVRAAPGADTATLTAGLDRIAATVPGASVAGRASLVSQNSQIQQILVSANYTIVGMIVGYAAITVINSLVAVTGKRRREFGLQRLTGATRGQVIGMVGVEGVLIAVIGTVLGTIAAATTFVPYSLVKSGSPIPSGGIGIYLAIIGGSLALVFAATLLPAWRGMRTAPIESVATAD
ncbi:MAG TPA: FtsX-like permease family protein [Pseudonocardiaceae bacterium]